MAADITAQQRKLQILCLHGSRQDGEVFSQRLKTLRKKLSSIADLHFASAPHVLPLQDGQSIPMRAWWRHWNIAPANDIQQRHHHSENTLNTAEALESQQPPSCSQFQQVQDHVSLPHGKAREEEVHHMMAAGWEAVVLRDWAVSLQHLCGIWQAGPPIARHQQSSSSSSNGSSSTRSSSSTVSSSDGSRNSISNSTSPLHVQPGTAAAASNLEYDGILGFSNGAAAAFLFAAHAAANPHQFTSLRFVALAGGYVPEPLVKLIPQQLLKPQNSNQCNRLSQSNNSSDYSVEPPPVDRLIFKLPFPSLHMMGSNDPLMDVADSSQLMDCFQEQGRVQIIHDSGHAVPQQSRWMQDIIKFVVQFADIQLPLGHHKHHKPHKHPAAAAAAAVRLEPQKRAAAAAAAAAVKKPAAAAAAGVAADTAEIEAMLHRHGLRDRAVAKGPAHKHLMLKVDPAGQVHQHVDIISHKAHQHSKIHKQQQQQQQSERKQQQQPKEQQQQQQLRQQQQQQQQVARKFMAAAAAVEVQAAAAVQDEFGEATDIQLEEIEALQAIYSSEFFLISSNPPSFSIKLREPTDDDDHIDQDHDQDHDGQQEAAAAAAGPPSRLFTLKFKFPKDYPVSATALPNIDIEGPLGKNDPARAALSQYLTAAAVQQQQEMGGTGGYIWQLANSAKDWIDENLPADIGSRRAGDVGDHGVDGADTAAAAAAAAKEASSSSSSSKGPSWWEKDEIDLDLVEKAIAEAAAAHWRSWAIIEDDNPFGEGSTDTAAAAAAGSSSDVAAAAAAAAGGGYEGARGRWDYTIGLVGKPSAGKSTFFNAVVDPVREEDAAREAPFPFTTISPNIGRGFIVLPDPAPLLGFSLDEAQPAYGYALGFDMNNIQPGFSNVGPLLQLVKDCGWQQQQQQQMGSSGSAAAAAAGSSGDGILWRKVPVVVKDVAGLVPGAYQGRGHGNAFLNDLCDADVLVHVVDVSGTTDSEGAAAAAGEGADPTQEIRWVRQELHCWVYDNVRAKWSSVLRRPSRLPGLFTGYHAQHGLVAAVLRAVGVRLEDLAAEGAAAGNAGLQGGTKESRNAISTSSSSSSSLSSWGEWELHKLVAHFLAARFPILLALNKADLPSAQQNIRTVLSAHPHDAAVAVSAAVERKLQQLRRAGQINYLDASATATITATAANGIADSGSSSRSTTDIVVNEVSGTVLQQYGSTGVLAALTCAVALKPPRWVFPISDKVTCAALAAVTSRSTAAGGGQHNSHHGSRSSGHSSKGSHAAASASSALGWGLDAKARAAQGAAAGVLRDCILLKPGSRVEDVYQVLKRPPYGLLEGEFVRAECRVLGAGCAVVNSSSARGNEAVQDVQDAAGQGGDGRGSAGQEQHERLAGGAKVQCRVVRKDELVGPANCVLLLQTNRKVSWQANASGRRHH